MTALIGLSMTLCCLALALTATGISAAICFAFTGICLAVAVVGILDP